MIDDLTFGDMKAVAEFVIQFHVKTR
jgi:hypothetical protein